MFYFDHDVSASKDDKIIALRLAYGGAAVDAYWSILECLYETETNFVLDENQPQTTALTHRLCVGFDHLMEWVEGMIKVGLLMVPAHVAEVRDDGIDVPLEVYSPRANERIEKLQTKAETARQNGKKGGRKPKKNPEETQEEPTYNPEQTQEGGDLRLKTKDLRLKTNKDKLDESGKGKESRHKHGEYKNVLLSDDDLSKLQEEFPNDWADRIERLSSYMASTGKSYKNHLVTIRNWAKRDEPKKQEVASRYAQYDN